MLILNKRKDKIPPNSIYIGRPSEFGNPFIIGKDGGRKEVIEKYEIWLRNQLENKEVLNRFLELRKYSALICWCKPLDCHGDVIAKILKEIS